MNIELNIKPHHILIISMMVFVVLNLVENYLHYNIGRNANSESIYKFHYPSLFDWIQILFLMILFGFLQGFFTEFFSEYY